MSATVIVSITGIILSLLGVWIVFILSAIKKSQDSTNREIKEMNKDIREVLIQLAKNDEKIINITTRIDDLVSTMKELDHRVLTLEQS